MGVFTLNVVRIVCFTLNERTHMSVSLLLPCSYLSSNLSVFSPSLLTVSIYIGTSFLLNVMYVECSHIGNAQHGYFLRQYQND
jgi:hypothetical protein